MKTIARLCSLLLAASCFMLPLVASAETKAPGNHKADGFPMKTEAYKKLVDSKIDQLKQHFEHGLAAHSFTPDHKLEMHKSTDEAIKELHAAVDKAGANGVVTREEAKHVKDLSQHLRTKLREQLRGKHAKAKANGAKRAKRGHAPHGKLHGNAGHAKAPAKKVEPKEAPKAK